MLKIEKARFEKMLEYAWLNVTPEEADQITYNPLGRRDEDKDPIREVFRLMRNPKYFHWTAKRLLNIELAPYQVVILQEMWYKTFPMLIGSRGLGKTWLLAVYAMLRATMYQNTRIVVVGSAFRQAKYIHDYCSLIWLGANVLRNMVNADIYKDQGPKTDTDRCTLKIGTSKITALPIGTGEKIRGERAHVIMADEFAAQNREIFETVITGFGVVTSNPVDNMKKFARMEKMKEYGVSEEKLKVIKDSIRSNQVIISGTADFSFNHFCTYWKRWKTIINSKGDSRKLIEANIDPDINWRDYSVIRIPYDLIPGGYMDEKQIIRSKSTQQVGIFQNEFGAVFSNDSTGFFPRSLIEACVAKHNMDATRFPKDAVPFCASLQGEPGIDYVYGVDPASEKNNFTIQILGIHNYHARIIYGWSTNRNIHKDKVSKGVLKQQDFYWHAARKLRDLMKVFPCRRLAIDSQGGGISVMEALNDPRNMEDGELPLWPVIDPDKPKDSDDKHGLHIIVPVQFASAEYTNQANHGLKKDMEDKVLLFPEVNDLELALAMERDISEGRIYDTLEDCVMEIEALKDELATIVHSKTANSNRDRWDTPEIKKEGGKKGRLNKDRYSALLMANMEARNIMRNPVIPTNTMLGGFVRSSVKQPTGKLYIAPDWYNEQIKSADVDIFGFVAKKSV